MTKFYKSIYDILKQDGFYCPVFIDGSNGPLFRTSSGVLYDCGSRHPYTKKELEDIYTLDTKYRTKYARLYFS